MSITYKIEIDNSKIENFLELVEKAFVSAMEFGKAVVKDHLEALDEELMLSRDTKKYRHKGSRKTAVKTKLGTIEYSRRIYFDTNEKKHVYLLDEALNPQNIGLFDEAMCKRIEEMICNQSFRETASSISENTGLHITPQTVWNIVQEMGRAEIENSKKTPQNKGAIESKILYEEADGDWLKLQGEDRKKYGVSKEMKIGIVYDGVRHITQKNGEIRRELDNKAAYASFEPAGDFRKHMENVTASVYNTDEIELRVKNGDGAQWIQKNDSCNCICVLDEFHRNKKITECVSNKEIAENLRELLLQNRFDELLDCIEAYINSTEDERERAKLQELYSYYSENKEALAGYYDRGIEIPPTREPGIIHHANLGSMEGNVFTIIGNRMKGRRACWSVNGGNNLAALLCRHYSTAIPASSETSVIDTVSVPPLSASKAPKHDGKGYEFYGNVTIPNAPSFIKAIFASKPLSDLNF